MHAHVVVKGHNDNKWNDYVDELATRGRQGDRGSNAAEWADDTIPTDTPDEGSNAEGGDSSTIGHGATGGGQDSEREDDSEADCGPATPTASYKQPQPASPVSHPSPDTDPETASVANPRLAPPSSRPGRKLWPLQTARPLCAVGPTFSDLTFSDLTILDTEGMCC